MKQIFIYINAVDICPSGYYRILQYFERQLVTAHGLMPASVYKKWHTCSAKTRHKLSPLLFLLMFSRSLAFLLHDLLTAKEGDILIINRTISPHFLPPTHSFLLKCLARKCRIIWDFDDNMLEVHTISRKEHNLLSAISEHIIVTGDYLKNLIAEDYQSKVIILPTTDGDMVGLNHDENTRLRKKDYEHEVRLVWVGSGGNITFVERILPALDDCARTLFEKDSRRLILDIVSNIPIQTSTRHLVIRNKMWSREVAIQTMRTAHIGIMPLIENPFTLGKGGFKLIQYLSVGLPVIGSAIGYNIHVIGNEDCGRLVYDSTDLSGWAKAIFDIIPSWDKYMAFSQEAYHRYNKSFSYERNLGVWKELTKK